MHKLAAAQGKTSTVPLLLRVHTYWTLEHHLREEQKQKLCLLEQLSTGTFSELWETEGVVKRQKLFYAPYCIL